jgi:hypothetical protein
MSPFLAALDLEAGEDIFARYERIRGQQSKSDSSVAAYWRVSWAFRSLMRYSRACRGSTALPDVSFRIVVGPATGTALSDDVRYLIQWKANRRAFEVLRNGFGTETFGYSRHRAVELAILQAQNEATMGEVSVASKFDGRDITDWRRAARCARPATRRSTQLQV